MPYADSAHMRCYLAMTLLLATSCTSSIGTCEQEGELCSANAEPDSGPRCVGGFRCEGQESVRCSDDGQIEIRESCETSGLVCAPASGRCDSPCSDAALGSSYIGCEYFATITANEVDNNFAFSLAISNTSPRDAQIEISGGSLTTALEFTVEANSVHKQALGWVPELKLESCNGTLDGCGIPVPDSAWVAGGAFRIVSNEPVTVYQFSPLEFHSAGQDSFTNDASLLLPVNALGTDYVVAAWQDDDARPSLVSVTVTQDGTELSITPSASAPASRGAPRLDAAKETTMTAKRGDVVQFVTANGDFSGTRVRSSAPVQVIGGHYCATVGQGYCDHLEESMFPVSTLGREYIVSAPADPRGGAVARTIRIVATESDTHVEVRSRNQQQEHALSAPGEFVELPFTADSLRVLADRPVLVAQYMQGVEAGVLGDPSMTLAVPKQQFRRHYLFHAPLSFIHNYVNVVAPDGVSVELDGAALSFEAGPDGFNVARVELARQGSHEITGTGPFGITVYGYGDDTSYWYPGGLDLRPLNTQ